MSWLLSHFDLQLSGLGKTHHQVLKAWVGWVSILSYNLIFTPLAQVLATKVAFSTLEYVINNSFTLFPRCSWTLVCSSRTNNQNLSWMCTSLSAWLKWKYTTLLWYDCLDYSDSTTPNSQPHNWWHYSTRYITYWL
jgi:hypothetical protein